MKTKVLIVFAIIFLIGCSKEKPQDPLVGKWHLKQYFRNDSLKDLSECALLNTIEFKSNGYYTEEYFIKDTVLNTCVPNGTSGYKWSNNNGQYTIDNGSIVDQNHQIKLENNKLIYSYEGWHFTSNTIVTSDIKLIYQK
ncbi:lipocalin family protein [Flavobacterium sp.]|jgi:hypothetical protein|uniref:lipocalin family protein n=1 Tax=Flavobacterium sp. TaxID=239 RepID=UPI0038D17019